MAFIYVFINLLVDIIYTYIDPHKLQLEGIVMSDIKRITKKTQAPQKITRCIYYCVTRLAEPALWV